jgi:hypothetical protein
MKNIYNLIRLFTIRHVLILTVLLVVTTGCTKEFVDRNTPQNELIADKLDPGLLGQVFARIQYQCIFGFSSNIWNNILYEFFFSQYAANNQPIFQSDQYFFAGVHMDRAWNDFYSRASGPLHYIEEFTTENDMPLENAIAKIWRVEAYQRATDAWGPIIYFEAGNGKTSVDYDSQQDIYMDFFKTLDEATAVLKQNPGSKNIFGSNDQMYQGDGDKWLKFANSLRLRVAMRLAYIDPATAQLQAEKAVADGVMTDNSDNAKVICTINSINGLASSLYHDEWRMSASMYSVLEGWHDPRMNVYFAPVWNGGAPRGLRNGLPIGDRDPDYYQSYSPIGLTWRALNSGVWGRAGDNPPMKVMVSAEVYFLRAEGALRGWNMGGTAESLYNEGIRMSLTDPIGDLNVTPEEIDAYIHGTSLPVPVDDIWHSPPVTNIPVAYQSGGSFETQLEQIITQKWLAIFPDGSEAWAERRRTGYPRGYALIESVNPDLSEFQLPRRKPYPPGEAAVNAAALEKAKALLGGPDNGATRLWWDAKPLNLYPTPAN